MASPQKILLGLILYLPPAIAIGLFVLVMGALTPVLIIIYAVPSALIAGVVGLIVYWSCKGKACAMTWPRIVALWAFAILMWVIPEFYWVLEDSDPCEHNEKRLVMIHDMMAAGTWQLPPSFFTEGRREERIRLTATSDFIAELGLGANTDGKISAGLERLQDVQTYDGCQEERWGRRLNLVDAETNVLVAVLSGGWSLTDCRMAGEAEALVEAMIDSGYWTSLEIRTVNDQVAEDALGDPQMVLGVSEKFRLPSEIPRGEAYKRYRDYYNAAAIFAVCTGHSASVIIDKPWDDALRNHAPKAQESMYLNDPIRLPEAVPDW